MDLYSILGHQLSVDQALPPETASAAAALSFRVQPLDAASSLSLVSVNEDFENPGQNFVRGEVAGGDVVRAEVAPQNSEEYALALRLLSAAKFSKVVDSTVERVRYITNASGVALALCENEDDAMVCRASSGPSAPEVGSRMYIRSGITAESLRTRQTLRCDHASTDPRVNQESCKALGIESVMVLPLVLDRNVVGMFQLFSSKPSAFAERDATTLRASLPQVETAVRDAVAAGMPLGRIPWAQTPDEAVGDASEEVGVPPEAEARPEGVVPNAIPIGTISIDTFRKIATVQAINDDQEFVHPETGSQGQHDDQQEGQHEDQHVPAFLARLADEARPASNRGWSQWFRPQW